MEIPVDLGLPLGWGEGVAVEVVVKERRGKNLGRDDGLEDATEVGRQVG